MQRNSAVDARFERKSGKGKFMFNLKATNGQVVGTSERYDTESVLKNPVSRRRPETAVVARLVERHGQQHYRCIALE